jgi:peptide chain release factor 2
MTSARTSESALKRSGGIFDVDRLRQRVVELEARSSDPEFWTNQALSKVVLKEKVGHERAITAWERLMAALEDAEALLELGEEAMDTATIGDADAAFRALETAVSEVEIRRLLSDEGDDCDAILEINSGAGGTDASDWAEMLERMYMFWADKNGFKASIVDEQRHDEAGIKSCTIEVRGTYAYGYLKAEIGVHRLVRISPFDAAARRHTAFASVAAYPDIDDTIEVEIKEGDLRVDTYRSSGAGGQHVNTTDSAVRLTHLPTGLVVACQQERSQHKNRATALKLLRAKIYQYELQKRQEVIDAANALKSKIEWGSQIRSYVLQPYRMVKDTRTNMENTDTDAVLNGDLNGFMEAWLVQRRDETEAS